MKIAILGIKTLPAFAGADRVVERLLDHFPEKNDYYVYLLKGKTNQRHTAKNIHYIFLPCLPGKHARAFSYFALCTLHFLLVGSYDVAHVHNIDFGFFVPFLRLRNKVNIVGTFHGSAVLHPRQKWGRFAMWYLKSSEKVFIYACHHITTVSKSVLSIIPESMKKKVQYIPNGFDVPAPLEYEAPYDLRQHGLEKGKFILFACGRLDSTKGLHYLLRAYCRGNFTEKLLVIGDTRHDIRYSAEIEAMIIEDSNIVLCRNLLPKNQLFEVIRTCRLFVFPSQYEAMSMMLLEVIGCEKLVVCSSIPENVEITGPDYPYLFSVNSEDDLAKKLRMALNDPRASELAHTLLASCQQRFSWDSIAQQYLALYEKSH